MGLIRKLPVYAEKIPGGAVVTTSLEGILHHSQACSLWYLLFGTACCAIELMATGASRYDFDRLGMIFRASPRQSDLIIAAGTITKKMAPRLRKLYDQMAEPRYVIAMGGCTVKGGPFYYDSYAVEKGIDHIVPVDVYIPGCPPRPESLLEGCLTLQKKIKSQKLLDWQEK
ncbi:MAG TPA: NADH-quinone oxidoreductase subunit B family protein [Candidatus Acidoferrum sp.]|nr:NADH-quinone oxidoreductase subunit B family protein [Candidatus Acidoferrum sp.]